MTAQERLLIEKHLATLIVKEARAHGWTVSVHDGEEYTLEKADDEESILDEMFSTDEDALHFFDPTRRNRSMGWIQLIYGNEGHDVVHDYSGNLDAFMKPIEAEANRIEREGLVPTR